MSGCPAPCASWTSRANYPRRFRACTAPPPTKNMVMLDVAVDPKFTQNHRIFFTFGDYFAPTPGANDQWQHLCRQRAAGRRYGDRHQSHFPERAAASLQPAGRQDRRAHCFRAGWQSICHHRRPRRQSPADRLDWLSAQKLDNRSGQGHSHHAGWRAGPGNPFTGQAGARPELGLWHAQSGRARLRSQDRPIVGNRTGPARRR